MITIKLEGFDALKSSISVSTAKLNKCARLAISKTANAIRDAEKIEMERVFDRPTRWTLGAMIVRETGNLSVQVGIMDPKTGRMNNGSSDGDTGTGYWKRAESYLGTQIDGGQRKVKAMEKALQAYGLLPQGWFTVPGAGAEIDSYGNMNVGQIRQILSYFQTAERWSGSTQNMSQKRKDKLRKGSKKKVGFEYVVIFPDKRRNMKQPGIYQRFFFGHGRSIKPILIYINKANYKPRFNFESVASNTADQVLQPTFDDLLKKEGLL